MLESETKKYENLEDPGIRDFLIAGDAFYPADAVNFSIDAQRAFYDCYCAHFRKARPAAFGDCWVVLQSLAQNHRRLIAGGDSAGGNLAAALALKARDAGGSALSGQVLIYPGLGGDMTKGSFLSQSGTPGHSTRDVAYYRDTHKSGGSKFAESLPVHGFLRGAPVSTHRCGCGRIRPLRTTALNNHLTTVMPAQAGIPLLDVRNGTPGFAGVTNERE
jgi:acetyl esterase/lipase